MTGVDRRGTVRDQAQSGRTRGGGHRRHAPDRHGAGGVGTSVVGPCGSYPCRHRVSRLAAAGLVRAVASPLFDRGATVLTLTTSPHVVWHRGSVDAQARADLLGQTGVLVWLTGLPSSGKSTIAFAVEHQLLLRGRLAYVLDGDNVRHGLNANLGFSPADRSENIRRVGEVGKLFVDAGLITLASFVSPCRADRDQVRALLPPGRFLEVFVDAPVEVCEQRDPKGLYRRARAGEVRDFTGVNAPYEAPQAPELAIATGACTAEEAAERVLQMLEDRAIVPPVRQA